MSGKILIEKSYNETKTSILKKILLVKTIIEHPIKEGKGFGVPLGLWVLKDFLKYKDI